MSTAASLVVLFLVAVVPLAPTEVVLIGAGVLAAAGEVPLYLVVLIAAAGCLASDLINFSAGRRLGMKALAKVNRNAKARAMVVWTADQLASRGETILIAARFLPAGGIVGALLTGALKWPLRRFVPVAAVGSALWSLYPATVGYIGGQLVEETWLAMLLSFGVATAISAPIGMAIRARNANRTLSYAESSS
ncbi:membrane protein DedA, SNARE-associated domain [Lentzea fradiae]|uniref:Membrane protein DedA, SNARE-associated domain n=1 Tax=Lentzea fradiae TaxID=200378 RepID=A0A1G8AVM7_9PSEU|nr:membrane protein DedA, SNARE-associated domain [Lentzea fradiae]